MRYGFVIDQNRCIGCHACTVACKEEHQVPLGVFRTWVKAIEKGRFPHSSRHFGVYRCNHCDSAPCSTICPTLALYRRSDGIIDFDNQRCIGCKSCMQACPYDALYIDPNTNTAAKCNFCAHRVEAGLEPACVVVCPTQAILAGDLDDAAGKVSRIVATQKVSVRKPQKGTDPKLYYIGIDGNLLAPTSLSRQNGYAFAERKDQSMAEQFFNPAASREVYDVAHPSPWGWRIAAYLWTKSIAAGVMIVAATLIRRDGILLGTIPSVVSPVIALIALALTAALLILDLKRPDRFFLLLTKPNFRSWLVIGAYILMAFGAVCAGWLASGLRFGGVPGILVALTVLLAMAGACYSAFLFAQARGRDLWQSPMFFWHLLIHAIVAGSAVLLLAATYQQLRLSATEYLSSIPEVLVLARRALFLLLISLLLSFATTMTETFLTHVSEDARLATQNMVFGRLRARFWGLAVCAGMVLPMMMLTCVLVSPAPRALTTWLLAIAPILALAGVWWYEDVWVKAGQSVPLS
jgi:Fe-S-cluster-containing dehydrogenase component/formate-dependent nitrite reductase membrane component NrfD